MDLCKERAVIDRDSIRYNHERTEVRLTALLLIEIHLDIATSELKFALHTFRSTREELIDQYHTDEGVYQKKLTPARLTATVHPNTTTARQGDQPTVL